METGSFGIIVLFFGLVVFALATTIVIFFSKHKANILRMENQKQIETFKAIVEAEEKQKERIAKNLHDEVTTTMTVLAQHIDMKYGEDRRASELIEQIISGTKAVSLDLMPKMLFNFGLIKAIEQYIWLLNKDRNVEVEIENNTNFNNNLPFEKNDQVNIYRACLEILNNIQKHTGCTCLKLNFDAIENNFVIEFTHNGQGIDNTEMHTLCQATQGLGLKSLKSRLLILNAEINYYKEIDNANITLFIPLRK